MAQSLGQRSTQRRRAAECQWTPQHIVCFRYLIASIVGFLLVWTVLTCVLLSCFAKVSPAPREMADLNAPLLRSKPQRPCPARSRTIKPLGCGPAFSAMHVHLHRWLICRQSATRDESDERAPNATHRDGEAEAAERSWPLQQLKCACCHTKEERDTAIRHETARKFMQVEPS